MLNEKKEVTVEDQSYLDRHLSNLELLNQRFININHELEILSNKAGYSNDSCQIKVSEPPLKCLEKDFYFKDKVELLFNFILETQNSIDLHVESLKRFI